MTGRKSFKSDTRTRRFTWNVETEDKQGNLESTKTDGGRQDKTRRQDRRGEERRDANKDERKTKGYDERIRIIIRKRKKREREREKNIYIYTSNTNIKKLITQD